jgi:hypothetical protein
MFERRQEWIAQLNERHVVRTRLKEAEASRGE